MATVFSGLSAVVIEDVTDGGLARAYMQPETRTRPALSSLLLDRLLVFTPKK
ncbi:hypothetical protein ACIGFK_15780 [Streptomyces sp. NPDC085524]|uniref:hypothetical protein n=1 Tax=Streptomyces sp. NPDC085524 TaxID=3365728 RepID=UPI0037D5A9FA